MFLINSESNENNFDRLPQCNTFLSFRVFIQFIVLESQHNVEI